MIKLKKIKAGPLCENEMPEMQFCKTEMLGEAYMDRSSPVK